MTVDNIIYSNTDSVMAMFQNYNTTPYIVVKGAYHCVWTVLFETVV